MVSLKLTCPPPSPLPLDSLISGSGRGRGRGRAQLDYREPYSASSFYIENPARSSGAVQIAMQQQPNYHQQQYYHQPQEAYGQGYGGRGVEGLTYGMGGLGLQGYNQQNSGHSVYNRGGEGREGEGERGGEGKLR